LILKVLITGGTVPSGWLAAALIGVGAGGEAAITPYLLTRYFGLRAFSTLYGLTWTFYAAAGAIGPVLLGRAFDATGFLCLLADPPRSRARSGGHDDPFASVLFRFVRCGSLNQEQKPRSVVVGDNFGWDNAFEIQGVNFPDVR
jgi:MFS family permease